MAKVGDKVPSATLRMLGPEGPKAVTTEELFAPGKKVVAFALPGASPHLFSKTRARVRGRS
jgi:Peroxiredoxin